MHICHEAYYFPTFFSHDENGNDVAQAVMTCIPLTAKVLPRVMTAILMCSEIDFGDVVIFDKVKENSSCLIKRRGVKVCGVV